MDTKSCTGCGEEKSLDDFARQRKVRDGRKHQCKTCQAAYLRAWRDENRERLAAQQRIYYQNNKEKADEATRRWREENPDYWKHHIPKWREENRQLVRHYNSQRRARKAQALGSHTEQEWRDLCESFGDACLACGAAEVRLTRDHIVPLTLGGSNDVANLQPLCGPCNSKKGVSIVDYRGEFCFG
jgi:5-methylcytosine-specific restriction endonuclease McrA